MTTSVDRDLAFAATDLDAAAVLPTLMRALGPDFHAAHWRVSYGAITVQYAPELDMADFDKRQVLLVVAQRLDLDYVETVKRNYTAVSAKGIFGGVRVEIWDHVNRAGGAS